MPLHWPTFFTRLGSAIVFSAVMMAGLLWNEWAFLGLTALIQFLCLRDFFRLAQKIDDSSSAVWLIVVTQVAALGLLALVFFSVMPDYEASFAGFAWPMLLFLPVTIMIAGVLSPKSRWRQALHAAAGLLYIVLPCLLLLCLRAIGWVYPLALVLMIWMNDTMAYLVGSFIGRTPFSKISPKKTWEGTAGGALLTVIGAAAAAHYIPGQSMQVYIGLALCAAIAGTGGDLFESKLKRMAGVKDSGALMPGHGGALDRFDSLLVAVPFAFVWVILLQISG